MGFRVQGSRLRVLGLEGSGGLGLRVRGERFGVKALGAAGVFSKAGKTENALWLERKRSYGIPA